QIAGSHLKVHLCRLRPAVVNAFVLPRSSFMEAAMAGEGNDENDNEDNDRDLATGNQPAITARIFLYLVIVPEFAQSHNDEKQRPIPAQKWPRIYTGMRIRVKEKNSQANQHSSAHYRTTPVFGHFLLQLFQTEIYCITYTMDKCNYETQTAIVPAILARQTAISKGLIAPRLLHLD